LTGLDRARKRLQTLLVEVRADRASLDVLAADVREAIRTDGWDSNEPLLALVAIRLHHYYTAAESVFERFARTFEGLPKAGDTWHRELLHAMTQEVPGARPGIVAPSTAEGLRELLAFRHFFRHAYAVDLDGVRLRRLAEVLVVTHDRLAADLDAFVATLEAVL